MSLAVYKRLTETTYSVYSSDDTESSPVSTVHDGRVGDTVLTQLFVRNDNVAQYFTNIVVSMVQDDAGTDELDGTTTGWGVKLLKSNVEPAKVQWDFTSFNNSITLDNIGSASLGDTSTYQSFWLLVQCPPQEAPDVKKNLKVRVTFLENAVA